MNCFTTQIHVSCISICWLFNSHHRNVYYHASQSWSLSPWDRESRGVSNGGPEAFRKSWTIPEWTTGEVMTSLMAHTREVICLPLCGEDNIVSKSLT